MDLARVQKKMGEAQFFLGKMSERERRAFGDHVQFDYYLSAFLNAAMSVRGGFRYLQNRKLNEAIKDWRAQWEKNLRPEERSLHKFMREDRRAEVHDSGSSRSVDIKVGAGSSYSDGSGTLEAFGSPSALLGVDTAVVIHKPTYYFTIDGAERRATEACTAYLARISQRG